MTLRVWLNRTFATNHHVVGMLHENPDRVPVQVLGSHVDPSSPVLAACAETFLEPDSMTGPDYVDYALQVCRTRGVDVFWPTRHQEAIAAHADRFTDQGTQVMVSGAEAIALFEDKAATYAEATRLGVPVPDHHVVTTAAAFIDAYTALKDAGHAQVCFKPVRGVGAEGFRIVHDRPVDFTVLTRKTQDTVAYRDAVTALASRDSFDPLMVMPVLAGGEVSVDTLSLEGKLLTAVPRFKRSGDRTITLAEAPDLVADTARFVEEHALSYLSNVQFRFDTTGRPFLLEVNTRASGGLFQSCLAAGNLPWYAVAMARDGIRAVPAPTLPVHLVTVATAVAVPAG